MGTLSVRWFMGHFLSNAPILTKIDIYKYFNLDIINMNLDFEFDKIYMQSYILHCGMLHCGMFI